MLPEISISPRMVTNFSALIKPSFRYRAGMYKVYLGFLEEYNTEEREMGKNTFFPLIIRLLGRK